MNSLDSCIAFIKETERLKGVLRTAWQSGGRQESTAEHSWRLALLASVLSAEVPELDSSRVLTMCLIHDLGELYDGDVSAASLPDQVKKTEDERRAVEQVFSLLPADSGRKYMELWQEYADGSTPEARFVKALDKAETIIQHNQGENPADFDYAFNLTYGAEYFRDSELLESLRQLIDADTEQRMDAKAK